MGKDFFVITFDKYPDGDAGSIRTHSLALIIKNLGYNPIVIGMGPYTHKEVLKDDGISYCSLRGKYNNKLSKLLGILLFKFSVFSIMKKNGFDNIGGIMFVSGGNGLLKRLKKLSLNYEIPLLYDCVEWYSPSEFGNGEKNYLYKSNNLINSSTVDENVRVIAISSYLKRYYDSKNIRASRIPVILDVSSIEYCCNKDNDIVNVVYAGMPGNKDKLYEFVTAICEMHDQVVEKLKFHIVGMTSEQYEKQYGRIPDSIGNETVSFLGRIPHYEAIEYVRNADFSVLLRDGKERFATAGFPTKAVESMSLGTPLLCNLTSDLGMYLLDGENCIVINDYSVEECKKAIIRILSMSKEQMIAMKKSARKCAEENFDYSLYEDSLRQLLE